MSDTFFFPWQSTGLAIASQWFASKDFGISFAGLPVFAHTGSQAWHGEANDQSGHADPGDTREPMIDININEVATGVLVTAIGSATRWLTTAAGAPHGRRGEEVNIARWFETYKFTEEIPNLPGLTPDLAMLLADVLRGNTVQAALQELLAVRLTDAAETDAARARESFCLSVTLALPAACDIAPHLAEFYDDQICGIVARLEGDAPALLSQIRSEALSARMIAVLRAIERHTAALASPPRNADEFLKNYRSQVIDHHGKLEPPDFDRRRRVSIRDIYVPAVIDKLSSERSEITSQSPPSITIWKLAERIDRSILLGDPGGGKTTASNVLMHYFASNVGRRVPFLVTLRNYAASDPPERSVIGHIEHELETFYQCPPPPGLVDALLLSGSAIVIFDGLDELLDTSRRADIAARVERFCTEYPLAPVLVTSRVVGYDQARLDEQHFICYRLGSFRDADVAEYARKWFALEPNARPGEAEAFLSESETVPDLRSNPLLLSLMCIVYRGEGSLPHDRAEIYGQCANLLYRKWDARRHIQQHLRAGRLIEPTLRHLAWWLFSRKDTHSAVTEHELVAATTNFLHGRGFEFEEDAREAAQEFIEFCRGRMWVFTDTGTTATGEKLYSFTHRTFLEYFAAARLAYDNDRPEKLASTLAPHVARGEWETVSELAVQIKDSTSTEGARRIYEVLLDDRRGRLPERRSNILQFLGRSLRSVDPTPSVVRRLTSTVVSFLLSGDLNSPSRVLPLSWLLASCDAHLEIVSDEIGTAITNIIEAREFHTHLTGLRLSILLDRPLRRSGTGAGPEIPASSRIAAYWTSQADRNLHNNADAIIAAAVKDVSLRNMALWEGLISVDQALTMGGGLQELLKTPSADVFDYTRAAYLPIQFHLLARFWPGPRYVDRATAAVSEMSAIGRYLIGLPQPPWVSVNVDEWKHISWGKEAQAHGAGARLDPIAYLGAAAVGLITAEANLAAANSAVRTWREFSLGAFKDIGAYIVHRNAGSPESALADLPVPDQFKQVFRGWAAGKVNFIRPST